MADDTPAAASVADTAISTPVGWRVQNRYRVVAELGRGAFGTVHVADDEARHESVALRLLPPVTEMSDTSQGYQRLGSALIAASGSHPGLVRVLAVGETESGQGFLVMERVEGRRLQEILASGKPLDVAAALRLALDIGEAVEALHNMGGIHGALRPCNVMVREDGSVKVMDTELVGLREMLAEEDAAAAESPAEYLAPEQLKGAPATEKTDAYAFAVLVYEMLCGVPPFRGVTRQAVVDKQLSRTPPRMRRWRHAVPASVERVVMQALHKEPERRPAMPEILNGLVVEPSAHAARPGRPAVIVGAAAVAAAVALPLAWTVVARHAPSRPPQVIPAPPGVPSEPPSLPPLPRPPLETRTPASPVGGSATSTDGSTTRARNAEAQEQAQTPPAVKMVPVAVTPLPPVPKPTAPAAAPPRAAAPLPPVTPTTRAPTPAAPRVGKTEAPPAPQTTGGEARERSAGASGDDAYDPGAIVDWLLKRPSAQSQ